MTWNPIFQGSPLVTLRQVPEVVSQVAEVVSQPGAWGVSSLSYTNLSRLGILILRGCPVAP